MLGPSLLVLSTAATSNDHTNLSPVRFAHSRGRDAENCEGRTREISRPIQFQSHLELSCRRSCMSCHRTFAYLLVWLVACGFGSPLRRCASAGKSIAVVSSPLALKHSVLAAGEMTSGDSNNHTNLSPVRFAHSRRRDAEKGRSPYAGENYLRKVPRDP